jgi:tRNA pseudouridine55 synthase
LQRDSGLLAADVPNPKTSIDGVIVIHKPVGPTSHDVVVCARRALGISRIGHTGTLDPQASGVLPLVLGQATRLAQHLTGTDKEYLATFRFGATSDTYDASGEIVTAGEALPTRQQIAEALARFLGTFEQVPPLYSAKMVGGERSYVRARAGKPVQPPAVTVTAREIELMTIAGATAEVRVRCSAGFYVRSLAHDVGQALGCGALLEGLVRTEAAGFRLGAALPFEVLVTGRRETLRERVQPMEILLGDLPSVTLTPEGVKWARHGRDLGPRDVLHPLTVMSPLVRMTAPDGKMLGLAEPAKTRGFLHPAVVFSFH